MELRVLGPLEAIDGTTPLAARRPQAARAARPARARRQPDGRRPAARRRPVGRRRSPTRRPRWCRSTSRSCARCCPTGVLHTRAPGYLLELEPEAVDVTRFAPLRAEGRAALGAGDPETRVRAPARGARAVARPGAGRVLRAVRAASRPRTSRSCASSASRSASRPTSRAGCHADVVGELEALVARHPLRESLHRQLTLALYRAGRQAEALAAYERFRQHARRGARDRAVRGAEGAAAADPQPGPAARARRAAPRRHAPRPARRARSSAAPASSTGSRPRSTRRTRRAAASCSSPAAPGSARRA